MNLAEYRAAINLGLANYLDKQAKDAPSTETRTLLRRLKKLVSNGKRFRPSLFFLTYQAYGGRDSVLDIGMAVELLHQALLVHDDLIDKDVTRNGQPNVVGMYKKLGTSLANTTGLLAGDYLLTLASKLVLEEKTISPQMKLDILELFNKTTIDTIYGQQLDSLNVNSKPKLTGGSLNKIYLLKTAKYSTVLPMTLAAFLLNLDKSERSKINKLAINLGIYVQLVNDYNNYFKKDHGEYLLTDYSSGKITYPFIAAQKLVNTTKLNRYFSKSLTANQKLKILDLLTNSGVKEASLEHLDEYLNKSKAELDKLKIKDEAKTKILALIDGLKV